MTTEEKIKNFIEGLGVQESKWRSLASYHREHNFNKEAEYVETRKKVIAEIKSEMENVFKNDIRKDGYPRFQFD